ncbi:MAG: hypothetical protein ACLFSQ_10905 [Candidatus Zixiibacteriota bacterium]
MHRNPVDVLIQQGYMIAEADEKFKGEDWHLPQVLRKAHDKAHIQLRNAHNKYFKALNQKQNAREEVQKHDEETVHLMSQLENYLEFSSEDDQDDYDNLLETIEALPDEEEEILHVLRKSTIPKLDNWDGTDKEIPESMKEDIIQHADDFAEAIDKNKIKSTALDKATKNLEEKKMKYTRQLTLVRSWLYTNLPNWRYDERLGLYGFKPLYEKDNPIPSRVEKISAKMEDDKIHVQWHKSENTRRYELFRKVDDGEFEKIYEFDDPEYYDSDIEKDHIYSYKARGISRWSKGGFSECAKIKT